MALKLYGFKNAIGGDLELMVRAHSLADAKKIFTDYVFELNASEIVDPGPPVLIGAGTLVSSDFNRTGVINGRDIPLSKGNFPALILPSSTGAATTSTVSSQINGDTAQFIAYIRPVFAAGTGANAVVALIKKGNNFNNDYAYLVSLAPDPPMFSFRLNLSSDGTAQQGASSESVQFPDGEGWIRITWSANKISCFMNTTQPRDIDYTLIDWTEVGVFGGGTLDIGGDIHTSSAATEVGDFSSPISFLGSVSRAIGIVDTSPTAAANWDMFPSRDDPTLSQAWTSGTGETWGVQGAAKIGKII